MENIYLDMDPKLFLQRIRNRNREGEQKMDLEWLHKYQRNHEEFSYKTMWSQRLTKKIILI
jgi:thymidylate kinase